MEDKDLLSLSKDDFMRRKIAEATKSLLRKTALEKVTVTAVCKNAGIARSSFYNLFTDIDDVLDWEFGRIFDMTFEMHPFRADWREALTSQYVEFMEYMLADSAAFKQIGKGMSRVEYSSIFSATSRRRINLFSNIVETYSGKPVDDLCAFGIRFFVRGESTTFAEWMPSMKESPEELARHLVDCVPIHFASTMDSCFLSQDS